MSKSTRKRIPKNRRCPGCKGEGGFGRMRDARGKIVLMIKCDDCGGSGRLKDRVARILAGDYDPNSDVPF